MTTPALARLRAEDRARIEGLLARRKWALPGEHPIARLDGIALGDCTTIALLGPKNAVGSRYYQIFLADAEGRLADGLLALGLHNSGPYPAFNWIEMTQYNETPRFGEREIALWDESLDATLFAALSALVPDGGHIMVEYDSPSHRATERILTLRYPIAATPIGYRMFEAGVRSYRDWYISEGGREGPRKLQGYKPFNDEIAREKTASLRAELDALLAAPENEGHGEWGRLARALGRKVRDSLS
ncbi:MAG: DUF1122 family protein [Dehalococcoidia bacterium]